MIEYNGTSVEEIQKSMQVGQVSNTIAYYPPTCPHCGRCPTCGRGGYPPYQQYWPYWNQLTCGQTVEYKQ